MAEKLRIDFPGKYSEEEIATQVQKQVDAGKFQPEIKQIKGKQNAAPNETYLPYVQDFVKNSPLGTPWGGVKDLGNAGLVEGRSASEKAAMAARGLPPYATQEEIDAMHAAADKEIDADFEDHAAGGAVDIEPDAVDHLRQLVDGYAGGGAIELEPGAVAHLRALLEAAA